MILPILVGAVLSIVGVAQGISPLSIKGSKFFDSDGNQFFIKGTIPYPNKFDAQRPRKGGWLAGAVVGG